MNFDFLPISKIGIATQNKKLTASTEFYFPSFYDAHLAVGQRFDSDVTRTLSLESRAIRTR